MFTPQRPFLRFVREERLFCAVLARLLAQTGPNRFRFFALINPRLPVELQVSTAHLDDIEIYPEFSYLRDDWFAFGRDNRAKRDRIFSLFARVPTLVGLVSGDFPEMLAEFNGCFMGERGLRIKNDIVYPGQWTTEALELLSQRYTRGPGGFRDLCRFKWAFNIKPDLVLVVPDARPICIEAKLESKEGSYPTGTSECVRFDNVVGPGRRVGQVERQQFMFSFLLGTPCQPVVIGGRTSYQDQSTDERQTIVPFLSWGEVFGGLNLDFSIPFIRRLRTENETLRRYREQRGV
jgi:hypothetical protein